jgi:transposase-like protein
MDIIEISEKFPAELSSIEYAEKIKYRIAVKCYYCGSENLSERMKDFRHRCKDCKKSTSVTVNSIIQGSKVPIKTWFYAISVLTNEKNGLSAFQLQRNISVSYPTAFSMYHKIRELMIIEN